MLKNSKKLLLSTVVASSILSTNLSADFLGAEVGFVGWGTEQTGFIKKGSGDIDLEKDLGYGDTKANSFMWAYIDHPIPLLPNLKIQKTNYTDNATGTMQKTVTFAGQSLDVSNDVKSELTLDQLDVIPYWRILDNWVNLDLGFNFKAIDGEVTITETSGGSDIAKTDFSVVVPMLYGKARFDMPFTGWSVEADISYIGIAGNKLQDAKGGIVYESSFGLGATVGYRKQTLTIDDIDAVYGELNIEGPYAGLFYHF